MTYLINGREVELTTQDCIQYTCTDCKTITECSINPEDNSLRLPLKCINCDSKNIGSGVKVSK